MNCLIKCICPKKKSTINKEIEKKPLEKRVFRNQDSSIKDNLSTLKRDQKRNSQAWKDSFNKKRISIADSLFGKHRDTITTRAEEHKNTKPHWEFKDKIRCLFCGGASCKHENYKNHKNPAIVGLHSDYITENIIASQRPSNSLIEKYDLIEAFKRY
jgi:hypothetical protein